MKAYRLMVAAAVLFLLMFSAGCVKKTVTIEPGPVAPPTETPEKPLPPPASPEIKPPEVKPAEILPPVFTPALARNAIGCVFPLTGRYADSGNKALDAVLLSAEIFKQNSSSPWKLVVADSGDTPESMRKAVAYLADEANVMAIIAISGSGEADDAALEAQKRKVPIILITSKEGVTQAGEYVFQNFLTPTQQARALTHYAVNQLNVALFSILYPEDDYGEEMTRLFSLELQKNGGKVAKAVGYGKAQTDFTQQIKKIAGSRFVPSDKVYASAEEARKKPSLEFEALFIPDSALRVKMIASQLAFYDVKGMKLLGTSLWHSPDLLKKNAEYLEGAVFADSFLVNGSLPETNDFVDIYYSAYRREPGNIEALSYDSMEIVLALLENSQIQTREAFIQALLYVEGFRGATGSTTFRGSRVAQKEAFILIVQNGKIEQVR